MKQVDKCVRYLLFFLMMIIIGLLVLMNDVDYVCKNVYLCSNMTILIGNTILFAIILGGGIYTKREKYESLILITIKSHSGELYFC